MDEIHIKILRYFYECWLTQQGHHCYILPAEGNLGFQYKEMVDALHFLHIEGLVKQDDRFYDHFLGNLEGVIYAESEGLIDSILIEKNNFVRNHILKFLAESYKKEKTQKFRSFYRVQANKKISEDELSTNLLFLWERGFIQGSKEGYRITESGLDNFNKLETQNYCIAKFSELNQSKKITPQQRGREFQKLISKVFEIAGWNQEESVSTSNEEIDVIIHKNREFYLIECKWEKKPIQPNAINHLLRKLNKRADTKGIIISMSGFTSGAVEEIFESTTQKLILLFGKEDIGQIIFHPASFEDLLNYKYTELVSRRKAIWK